MSIADRFAPHVLQDYALLADGARGALVGPKGEIVWMCAPVWDSDAVFSSLIGGGGGYAVTPIGRFVWGGAYEDGSLIWRSRWVTESGVIECREALAYPGDPHRAVLLRRILAVEGQARVGVSLDTRAGFGGRPMTGLTRHAGVWLAHTGRLHVRWQGAASARPSRGRIDRRLEAELTVPAGRHHDLVLEISDQPLPDAAVDPGRAWAATEQAWREVVPDLSDALAPRHTRLSYAVLAGLTSSSSGMVAAATTSLPERSEQGRNYDYRYVWIRDQCYAGHAAAAAGGPLLHRAVSFIAARLLEHGPGLAPAYTASGAPVPDQRRLDLSGYPGGYDLVGNWVNRQFQLDAFGESLLLFATAARHEILDATGWRAAVTAADAIKARWTQPDAGMWEIEPRAWTHSRLTAAAGLRSIAAHGPARGPQPRWLALADRIVADTTTHALHADGHWQRSPEDPALDAALLLPAIRDGIPADDPRSVATLAAYARDLTEQGYAYRFRHDERPLGQAEGSFTFCGFLMALATRQQGDRVAARGWWERSRAACGPPMLFSEEYDVDQRQMRGNLPQAFVHALMVETATTLD